jgi:hypothetical protein
MQTSYSNDPAVGFAGMRADNRATEHLSRLNGEASANLQFGVMVKKGANDSKCLLPSASTDELLGLVVSDFSIDSAELSGSGAVAPEEMASIARKGAFYVLPEQAVVEGDPVYVRYTDGSGALTVGRLRKDAGGVAQVDTVTPTAVNSTGYSLSIGGRNYNIVSDGSATATEICDAFRTLINADADCLAAGTGTTTLILTAKTVGVGFQTTCGANLALANTTPNAAIAKRLLGARFGSAASADAPAVLELNLPA